MRMHAFLHGHIAADRAKHTFGLTERECEAIARHMFPLAAMPRTQDRMDRERWRTKPLLPERWPLPLGGYISLACRKLFAYN